MLAKRAALWKKVLSSEKKAKVRRNKELYDWGMDSFIAAGLFRIKMKKFTKKKEEKLAKSQFKTWKEYLNLMKREKIIVKKVKKNWIG